MIEAVTSAIGQLAISGKDVLLGFVFAMIGAVLSIGGQLWYDNMLLKRNTAKIFGTWKSRWRTTIPTEPSWIIDEISIVRKLGRIHLTNSNCSHPFEYEASVKIVDSEFVIGEWKSLKGKQAHGVYCLVIGFETRYMVGYFFAPDVPGTKFASPWLLGRNESDLDEAQERLDLTTRLLATRLTGRSKGRAANGAPLS